MRVPSAADPAGPLPSGDFAPATRAEWRRMVAGVLRKSGVALDEDAAETPEHLLASTTYDGLEIQALYDAPGEIPGFPGLAPFARGPRPQGTAPAGWDVRQAHADPDPEASRRAVQADVANGVSSLWLLAGEGGIPLDGIGTVLADVDMASVPVVLDAGAQAERAAGALLRVHAEHGTPADRVSGGLGFDPLTAAVRAARTEGVAEAVQRSAREAAAAVRDHPNLRAMVADATPYHEAGGSEAQELGMAVAAGLTYLRALAAERGGAAGERDLAGAAARLEFRFAAGADQFLTIAKLRAARVMWNRVGEMCGLAEPDRTMRQHAVTSAAMMSGRDPYVNVLRAAVACFAAGAGGAEAVTVRPFDTWLGLPDAHARRLARNTQSILLEEAGLARVIDPAGGSGYVEHLTTELAEAGWRVLQAVERAGGMPAAVESGLVSGMVEETWRRRRENIARRRDPLTGVSTFPDPEEPRLERAPVPAAKPSAALPQRRYGQDFEALRDRSDAHAAARGGRPRVLLATLGPLAEHTARATFAADLLRAGGIEPVWPGPLSGPEEAADALAQAATPVACLCGGDTRYAEEAAAVVAALRKAGARRVLSAGGSEQAEADGLLAEGCDAVALLEELHEVLEVAR